MQKGEEVQGQEEENDVEDKVRERRRGSGLCGQIHLENPVLGKSLHFVPSYSLFWEYSGWDSSNFIIIFDPRAFCSL